ncbi:MAG: response regulator transcription factor [Acidobacteria bacterium]|nr:response regulator transcription factor [Acidobacteriota bacterium]
MIKILIADDHEIVRRGLKQLLAEHPDMTVMGEAETVAQALALCQQHPCDVILLDISMPGRSGLELISELKQQPRAPHVLVLSAHPEDQYALRVLKAGAAGYITKTADAAELVKAIRKVYQGRKYISEAVADRLVFDLDKPSGAALHESLSDREYQVLVRLGAGQTVGQIAAELSLSAKTISTYRSRILLKLNLENTAQLMAYALAHQLIE